MDQMTSEQKAQQLGITRGRVLVLAREGRFSTARKLGRDWIFDTNDYPDQRKEGPEMVFRLAQQEQEN